MRNYYYPPFRCGGYIALRDTDSPLKGIIDSLSQETYGLLGSQGCFGRYLPTLAAWDILQGSLRSELVDEGKLRNEVTAAHYDVILDDD